MRRISIVVLIMSLIMVIGNCKAQTTYNTESQRQKILTSLSSLPLAFTANKGQWDDVVEYRSNTGSINMWFTQNGAYYQFTRLTKDESVSDDPTGKQLSRLEEELNRVETMVIKATFIGSNLNPQITGEEKTKYRCNYFLGNDSSKWRMNVPNYSAIIYRDIYPGIDLKYYGNGLAMKYDFIVHPGADISLIKIRYDGTRNLSVTPAGDLEAQTDFGLIYEKAPYIYQEIGGTKQEVIGRYELKEPGVFSFALNDGYNPSYTLIIDPEIAFSTFFGGTQQDWAEGIAVDGSRNVYITGYTVSSNFPIENPYDDSPSNYGDVIISKFSSSGNILLYSTYLGGETGWEYGSGIAVDGAGNAYIAGFTSSTDFPTENHYDDSFNGGNGDAFVCKLSPSGNILLYSTYLGGTDDDNADCITVESDGNAYVTGTTSSSDFPTENAYDDSHNGWSDAFMCKLPPSGNALVYCTFIGGDDSEYGQGIAIDAAGNAYVAGQTGSSNFPTENPYDDSYNGNYDAFVCKLSPDGSTLLYGTYIGGTNYEDCWDIALDSDENAYITGYTTSSDFPTVDPYDGSYNGGDDVYICKLSSSGSSLLYSTYLGGANYECGWGITVDCHNNAFVTGHTTSSNFPTENAYDDSYNGNYDIFVSKLSSSGAALEYSTYLGGTSNEQGKSIAIDIIGDIYITGYTESSDFPVVSFYDDSFNGVWDIFITKIGFEDFSPAAIWHLDEGEGDIAYDETDNDNDGTIVGATWTSGISGNALYFGGWDCAVMVPHSTSLDITDVLFIEAWVKPMAESGETNYYVIVDKYQFQDPYGYGFTFYINNNGKLRFTIYSGSDGNGNAIGTTDLRDDNWHHVAGIWDGSNIRVYVDGYLEKKTDWTYPPASTTNDLGIGFRLSGHGIYNSFYGVIDEVNILTKSAGYEYLPGDVNMALSIWPPSVIGGDVTYLVGYFIGGGQESCNLDGFWCSADINGDCSIIGGDVTALVGYFVAGGSLTYCPDYEPIWPPVPDDPPAGWPNCDTPIINNIKVIPVDLVE